MRYLTTLLLMVILTGCNSSGDDNTAQDSNQPATYSGNYPIEVVATVGMVGDLVRNVGGEHVTVRQICGSGVDPHLYKPTRDDVQRIIQSDIVFYSGLMLEGKMSDTLVKVARSKPVFAVTEEISPDLLLEPDEFDGHYDPHVWMDVSTWSQCVEVVAQVLSDFDPEHADTYQANAKEYREELAALHEYAEKSIGTIPKESRILITSHDAFNYFGRAYDLDVQGVQGLSTDSEAGLKRVNGLVDLIVDKNIQAIFVESSVSRKNIDALIEGAQSRNQQVTVGGELFSDAMGEDSTYEGTYIGMLDHNVTLATRKLGGEAPPQGLNGKLQLLEAKEEQ